MLIFLYGEDTYCSAKKLKEIKNTFRAKIDPSGINIISFSPENLDLEKLNTAGNQIGFLVQKRLIIFNNLLTGKLKKDLAEALTVALKNFKDSNNIFVFWEAGQPDKRTSLFKQLIKDKKFVQEFTPLSGVKLNAWLDDYLKNHQAKISSAAKQLLLALTGNDLWLLANELDKLIAYKNGQEIKPADVEELGFAKALENIFGLSDALASNNKKSGLKLLEEQFKAGLNHQYLLTMIVRQFRIINQIKSLLDDNLSEAKIIQKTGLHPFVIKKSLPGAKKFSREKLKQIYGLLTELDKKFKSTNLPAPALMENLIMKI